MSCNNTNPFVVYTTQFSQQNCNQCGDPACGSVALDSKCVFYTGAALPCSGIATNDTLEVALQKIDTQICAITGDYSTYNTYCLAPITTQQEFVEAISEGYCDLLTSYNLFVGTTYPAYQVTVDNRFDLIEGPAITCVSAGITAADNLQTVYSKYCAKFGAIDTALDISAVDWSQCFVVVTPPTTIAEGFDILIDQICTVAASSGAVLPTFNNIGSCLPTPGANDTLVSTVNQIKTRLCQTGTFDINALTWGCIAQPSVTTTDLQAAMQEVLDQLNDYIENKLTFSGDFVVTQTNGLDVCDGKSVTLTTPIVGADRFVASDALDATPGTLADKMTAGTGVTLDFLSTPGQVIINATGSTDTYRVKANTADTTPDFLDQKVAGQTDAPSGISISTVYNALNEQVDFTPYIDWSTLINKIMDEVAVNVTAKIKFCTLVQDCIDNNYICNGYTVSLTPAQILANASSSFSYTDCNNSVQVANLIAPGITELSFCALRNSLSAPGLLVLDGGACVGSTTTTTTSTTTTTTTSTTTTTTTTTTTAGISLTVKYCSTPACAACGEPDSVVYTDTGTIYVGGTVYTDAGLTSALAGAYQLMDTYGSGVTFDINNVSGVITGVSAVQC